MAKQPINNGKVVERSYEDYRNNQYLVNRRYQRKLVWELEEKQAFIDSLANGYPVPLFLFAKCVYKGQDRSEIIDGMQRLNAVFSFIENDYPAANGEYFDLSTTALTKDLLDSHILEQRQPTLNRETCVKIVSYELPYSIYDEHNPDIIDEVFRRINSNGKHLSRQEIRQAGVVNDFSQLETLLKQSFTENTQYDFKQGIHNMDDGRRNNTLIRKIFKTLTAMANAGKNATGYVLLGVADTFEDAEKIRQVYGQESIRVGDFYVTGINGEVEKYYENYDAYILTIRNALNDMPLQDHYRRQIGTKMRHVNYHGKSVIILRITCNSGPAIFDGAYYTRSGPSNDPVPVKAEEMPAFFAQFA